MIVVPAGAVNCVFVAVEVEGSAVVRVVDDELEEDVVEVDR